MEESLSESQRQVQSFQNDLDVQREQCSREKEARQAVEASFQECKALLAAANQHGHEVTGPNIFLYAHDQPLCLFLQQVAFYKAQLSAQSQHLAHIQKNASARVEEFMRQIGELLAASFVPPSEAPPLKTFSMTNQPAQSQLGAAPLSGSDRFSADGVPSEPTASPYSSLLATASGEGTASDAYLACPSSMAENCLPSESSEPSTMEQPDEVEANDNDDVWKSACSPADTARVDDEWGDGFAAFQSGTSTATQVQDNGKGSNMMGDFSF